jgi:Fe-S cluster assembly scaffold protein SufB
MFYLKARGINELNSEKLLVKSFLIGNMDISYEERKIILENIDSHWR